MEDPLDGGSVLTGLHCGVHTLLSIGLSTVHLFYLCVLQHTCPQGPLGPQRLWRPSPAKSYVGSSGQLGVPPKTLKELKWTPSHPSDGSSPTTMRDSWGHGWVCQVEHEGASVGTVVSRLRDGLEQAGPGTPPLPGSLVPARGSHAALCSSKPPTC